MKLLDIKQHTPEWFDLRFNSVTASDAGVILGVGYQSPYVLWEQKINKTHIATNIAMQRGTDLEPLARALLEKEYGCKFFNDVYQKLTIPYMIASLDAYDPISELLIEIKCGKTAFAEASKGIISDLYYAQCQHQMEVMGLDKMKYVCFDGNTLISIDVIRDTPYIKSLLQAEKEFWECLENFTPPALTDLDWERKNDPEWELTAKDWHEIQKELTTCKNREETLRQKLIEMAAGKNCLGAGVKVTKVIREGNIQYDQIPELKGIDTGKFRKEPSTSYRLTKVK